MHDLNDRRHGAQFVLTISLIVQMIRAGAMSPTDGLEMLDASERHLHDTDADMIARYHGARQLLERL